MNYADLEQAFIEWFRDQYGSTLTPSKTAVVTHAAFAAFVLDAMEESNASLD